MAAWKGTAPVSWNPCCTCLDWFSSMVSQLLYWIQKIYFKYPNRVRWDTLSPFQHKMQSILRAKCAKLPQLFQLIIKRPSPRVNQVKLVIHLTESAHTSTKKESCWMILHFIHAEPCIITTCRSAMCSQRSTILLHTLAFVAECSSHTPWGPPRPPSQAAIEAIPAHLRLLWWLPSWNSRALTQDMGRLCIQQSMCTSYLLYGHLYTSHLQGPVTGSPSQLLLQTMPEKSKFTSTPVLFPALQKD